MKNLGKIKTVLVGSIILLVYIKQLDSQNLVVDPGFEEATHLLETGTWTNVYTQDRQHIICTSNLFNILEPDKYPDADIYQTFIPHTGKQGVGIILMHYDQLNCYTREFVQGRLIRPLKAGSHYRISMYVRLARSDYEFPLTDIGIALNDTLISEYDICEKGVKHVPLYADTRLISADHKWQEVSNYYLAKGGERYLTIGGFLGVSLEHILQNASNKKAIPYYFFDDISIVEVAAASVEKEPLVPKEPEPKVEPRQLVYFNHNSAAIDEQYLAGLQVTADYLKANPGLKLEIVGHTDDVGDTASNQQLSEKRAKAVATVMTRLGVAKDRLVLRGVGYHENIAGNNTEEGRRANRRCFYRLIYDDTPTADQLLALQDFAKLYGYIRYFYPKDWSTSFDWNLFAAYGVHRIRAVASPEALRNVLRELFLPLAPAMSLCESEVNCNKRIRLGQTYQFWQHFGVNSGGNEVYQSRLVNTAEQADWLFDKQPAQPKINGRLGSDLYYEIPLALPLTDVTYTYPMDSLIKTSVLLEEDKFVANTIIAWNLVQHFYPYLDYLELDWDAQLPLLLAEVASVQEEPDFTVFFKKMAAKLKDGHAAAYHPLESRQMFLPLELNWLSGAMVVAKSGQAGPQPGDILKRIDGEEVDKLFQRDTALVSGTPQWKINKTEQNIGSGKQGSSTTLTLERNGRLMSLDITRDWGDFPEPEIIKKVAEEVYYIDLKNVYVIDTLLDQLNQLSDAKAFIFDVRGYLFNDYEPLLARMLTTVDTIDNWMQTPQVTEPDQRNLSFQEEGWGIKPASPLLSGQHFFLTNGYAYSSSESFLAFVQHYQLGTIIGSPTAGANGSRNWAKLLLDYKFHWTGMYVTDLAGECYHARGIIPDVLIERKDWQQDEVLQRAIKEALEE
jgi:outer membrane protein OmpA-like peptidoglycan-associated protein